LLILFDAPAKAREQLRDDLADENWLAFDGPISPREPLQQDAAKWP
jgi:hypothetical protein